MKILVTCPPMLGMKEQFLPLMDALDFEVHCPEVEQTLTIAELIKLVPLFDGWIIGDDPATEQVFEAGSKGKLKAAVKWGVGVDNVDFEACKKFGIAITNTPNVFGAEVADLAIGYVIALARETFEIDRGIREGKWPKNRGISLAGKTIGIVGFGDIGKKLAARCGAFNLKVIIYDPACTRIEDNLLLKKWPQGLDKCDFLVFTCALNESNRHMLNGSTMSQCKMGLRVVNVARGPLIDECALIEALRTGQIYSAALDVFEEEPLPLRSELKKHNLCIFGSHNGSNTVEAVIRTNRIAIEKLSEFLEPFKK